MWWMIKLLLCESDAYYILIWYNIKPNLMRLNRNLRPLDSDWPPAGLLLTSLEVNLAGVVPSIYGGVGWEVLPAEMRSRRLRFPNGETLGFFWKQAGTSASRQSTGILCYPSSFLAISVRFSQRYGTFHNQKWNFILVLRFSCVIVSLFSLGSNIEEPVRLLQQYHQNIYCFYVNKLYVYYCCQEWNAASLKYSYWYARL